MSCYFYPNGTPAEYSQCAMMMKLERLDMGWEGIILTVLIGLIILIIVYYKEKMRK